MTVIVGILALIGLAVVGAIGWAFAHGVRDGLAAWREAPPGGTSQPVPVGEPPLPCPPRCRAANRPAISPVRSQPAGIRHTGRPEQLEHQAYRPAHPGRRLWPWAAS